MPQTRYTNAQIPTPTVSYTYSPVSGRLATVTDGTATTNYTYHPVNSLGAEQLASVDGPLANDTIGYAFTGREWDPEAARPVARRVWARLLAFNLAVCVVVAPALGTVLWGVLAGESIGALSRDLAGGWLLVYALTLVGPFGLLAAGLATLLCLGLLQTRMAERGRGPWLITGGGSGFLLGTGYPLMLHALGWGTDGDALKWALAYSAIGGAVGGICGVTIAAYSWLLTRRTSSPV